jgi:hypothetical protein
MNEASSSSSATDDDDDGDIEMMQTDGDAKENHNGDDGDDNKKQHHHVEEDHTSSSLSGEQAASVKTAPASSNQKMTDEDSSLPLLSEEAKTTLAKHEKMRERYCSRANEVLRQSQNLEEENEPEDVEIAAAAVPTDSATSTESDTNAFPDFAVKHLAALVEGSKLPLSALTTSVTGKLNDIYNSSTTNPSSFCFQEEATASQIKLLATRKSYIKNPSIASGLTTTEATAVVVPMDTASSGKKKDAAVTNIFEDDCQDCMWYVFMAALCLYCPYLALDKP